jgi:DNA-3-methyladenine glycosylase
MKTLLEKNTVKAAKELLGRYLVHKTPSGTTMGKIVETEAYLSNDPASHSSRGKTKRNEKMFGKPGTAYIYLIYGIYKCFNVVTKSEGIGEAVLVRALEPISGIELMKKRRKKNKLKDLCSGPAKLVSAMGITKAHNGSNLFKGNLKLISKSGKKQKIVKTTRVGITKAAHLPLRFYIKGNEFVSRK